MTWDRLAHVAPQSLIVELQGQQKHEKKHTISCKSYLSKTHFVRDLLQKCNLKLCKRKQLCETSFKNQTSWTSRDTVVAAMLLWFVTSSDSLLEVILYWSGSLLEVILYWSDSLLDLILYLTWFFTEMILYLKWTSTWSDPLLKWFSTWSDSLLEVILYLKWSDSLLSSMSVTRKFLNDSMMKAWHAMRMYQRKAVMVYWRHGMH